ncbi:MAG: RHS repeat-associated core domain-containing protein, partial [Firmicutes bacterium]|nr:RHS repeat-associated core domain-containing protein [Bacillota bacterium]
MSAWISEDELFLQGQEVVTYTYDAWGNITSKTDSTGTMDLSEINPFVYKGYWYGWSTGLYNLNARSYNPAIGRFLSEDPIGPTPGNALSYNEYAYAENDPVNRLDPSGEFSWRWINNKVDQLNEWIPPMDDPVAITVDTAEEIETGAVDAVEGIEALTEGTGKALWGSWNDYEHVEVDGQTYAKMDDRLYSKHAVDRMQPSWNRFGHQVTTAGGDYGRSVSPNYVNDVIVNSKGVLQENGNYSHTLGS